MPAIPVGDPDRSLGKLVVQAVVSAVGALATEKQLRLTADVASDLPVGQGDQRSTTQVLLNLTGNAIKFADTSAIAIGVTADGGSFLVSVSDTGSGIPEDQHERIFEEFQQVDASASRNKGTGLGLAIVKRIVELHRGRIWLESVVSKGSTFFLSLPIKPEGKNVAA